MEAWEQGWEAMPERLGELDSLKAAFLARENKPSLQWVTECMTAVSLMLFEEDVPEEKMGLLATLTLAMWQAGYEAAPNLEFVLPEGAGG